MFPWGSISAWKQAYEGAGLEGNLTTKADRATQAALAWLQQKDIWTLGELEHHLASEYDVTYESKQSYYDLFGLGNPLLQLDAVGGGPLRLAGQSIGNLLKLPLNMEYVAVARRFRHRGFLPRPQTATTIGNRIVRVKALGHDVQQMTAPGIFITMFDGFEQVAIR